MKYRVFALKWRPKKFSDVVGQQDIIKAIEHSFSLNRIHHAYILSGTRGIGKTTIARLFAKGLNCDQGLMYNVCGHCKNCQDIDSGCFIDLIEIDAAYYTKVEDIRDFLDNVQYLPSCGRFKVYLIDEVHMLSKHSFNALLKLLEEPPIHVKFILVTTDHQKLPDTIISRCLQFYLKPLSVDQISIQLKHICNIEKIKTDENALRLLAVESKGSMRDALNLLEQAILVSDDSITSDLINNMLGIVHINQALSLIENLIDGNVNDLMHQINNYATLGINWDSLFKEILTILQKIAINQFSSNFFNKQIDKNHIDSIGLRIYNLSNRILPENVQLYYQIFILSRRELPDAPSYRIGMEMAILRALAFFPVNVNSNNNQNNSDPVSVSINKDIVNTSLEKTENNLEIVHPHNIHNMKSSSHIMHHSNVLQKQIEYPCNKDFLNIKIDPDHQSVKTLPKITSKVLDIRSTLIKYQQHFNQLYSNNVKVNSDKMSKKISERILDKFSNIYLDIKNNNLHNTKKK